MPFAMVTCTPVRFDQYSNVTRNMSRLVAQGYTKIEGINIIETFTLVAHLEVIRLLLGISLLLKFKLYQMDVKSTSLNEFLNEEVYVEQPIGFLDPSSLDHVYKLKKALYGLKQDPRAWYEYLTDFFTINGYVKKVIDKTLFIKKEEEKHMID